MGSGPYPNLGGAIPAYLVTPPGSAASFKNIAANGNSQVKTGPGTLQGVIVNTLGVTSTLALYDGTSASGTPIATINTAQAFGEEFNLAFATGLFAVTAGGTPANVTITFE